MSSPTDHCARHEECLYRFCPGCGLDLRLPEERGLHRPCEHRVAGGGPFCPDCGADVSDRVPAYLAGEARKRSMGGILLVFGLLMAAVPVAALFLAERNTRSALELTMVALVGLTVAGLGWAYWKGLWTS